MTLLLLITSRNPHDKKGKLPLYQTEYYPITMEDSLSRKDVNGSILSIFTLKICLGSGTPFYFKWMKNMSEQSG